MSSGIVLPLIKKITLAADIEYRIRRFDAKHEQSPQEARNDDEGLALMTLSKAITPNVDFALQLLHQQNDSNISLFEYKRNIYGGRVTVRF